MNANIDFFFKKKDKSESMVWNWFVSFTAILD
jgi:hypothetical protein